MFIFFCVSQIISSRLGANSQNFNKSLKDALNRCDELETQLLSFESWIDLPIVNPADPSSNFDDVSDDAHRLVGILQHLQSALISAVSENALKDALPERQLTDVFKMEQGFQTQRQQQSERSHMLPQYFQPKQAEVVDMPLSIASDCSFTRDDQSMLPINDGPIPLGALNPTIPPQNTFTQTKSQARRVYSDVSSPFSQHQSFPLNTVTTDSNLMSQQQFIQHQQEAQGTVHQQGIGQHVQQTNNPGPYGL